MHAAGALCSNREIILARFLRKHTNMLMPATMNGSALIKIQCARSQSSKRDRAWGFEMARADWLHDWRTEACMPVYLINVANKAPGLWK